MPSEPDLAALAAELEIRTVLGQLAELADNGDLSGYLALMTDDVIWQMGPDPATGQPGGRREGKAQVLAGVRERTDAGKQGVGSATMHQVTTNSVHLTSPDHATASSQFIYLSSTTTTPQVAMVGRYADRLVRATDGWLLTERQVTVG